MKSTILQELSKPNPPVRNHAKFGCNTSNTTWPMVPGWTLWRDFTAEKLYAIFSDIVESDWTVPSGLDANISHWDRDIFDEDGLEHNIITKHILPPINAALQHAARHKKLEQAVNLNLSRAGRTYFEPGADRRYKPDWSACDSGRCVSYEDGSYRYINLLPGDTKLSIKWQSSFYESAKGRAYWDNPIRQIVHYCINTDSRYGFIITDQELVVVRIRTELTGDGLALNRPRRERLGHSHHASTSTDVSQLSASMRNASIADSSSAYRPTDAGVDGYPVEYRSIPWDNYGKGKRHLTIRLALFYLVWMAGVGSNVPQQSYPSLDSFWFRLDGVCIYNTTGLVSKKGAKHLEYPNPAGERGPRWVTRGDDGSEVLTLEVTESNGRYYYYYYAGEEDQIVLLTQETPIYDEAGQQDGYFEGLSWTIVTPGERSRPKKKSRK